MDKLQDFVMSNHQFVVAHRGSSGTSPENTLSAFRIALDSGAKMIETDIQLSYDGVPVAFHDKNLSRTSNGKGLLSQVMIDDLRKLDVGSWFSPDFANEKIPLLSEIFELIKDKAYINIEVKNIKSEHDANSIKRILDMVRIHNFEDYVLFSSFFYDTLKEIKKSDDNLHTAAIRLPKDNTLPSIIAKSINCEAFVLSVEELNEDIAADARNNEIYTGVYSIDTIEQLDYSIQNGATALVTNYPELIITELKSRNTAV